MVEVTLITSFSDAHRDQLCALLTDAVDDGTSLGFLTPLATETAAAYWHSVEAALQASALVLFVAADGEDGGRIVGTVQLAPCTRENSRHRAEIKKLCVLRSHRGRRIASQLMRTAEDHARAMGRTLLVLDTHQGRQAEAVYAHLGWQRAGAIPNFAATPDGVLHATVFFYKQLDTEKPSTPVTV